MSQTETYQCKSCGGKKTVEAATAEAPECCDTPMTRMPEMDACTISSTAEHSRLEDLDEPCDDGRSGKIG